MIVATRMFVISFSITFRHLIIKVRRFSVIHHVFIMNVHVHARLAFLILAGLRLIVTQFAIIFVHHFIFSWHVHCRAVVMGRARDGSETLTLGLIGRKEALMTAIVASETTRQLLSGNPVAGVLHSEQAIAFEPVISALRKELPDLVVAL